MLSELPSILSSDRFSRFEKKFAEYFFAKFQLHFDSLHLSLSRVSFPRVSLCLSATIYA